MKKIMKLMLLLLAFGIFAAHAQKPVVLTGTEKGWHKIGEITASFDKQTESIIVMGKDEFAAIKLKVTDAPINIERVEVLYEGGEKQEINVANVIQAGGDTRVIDLKASNREISRVLFTYKTLPNRKDKKADVELYGYKAHQDNSSESYDTKKEIQEEKAEMREEAREEKAEMKEEVREEKAEMKEEAREAREEAREEGDNAGNEVSEAAGKVKAAVVDQKFDGKVGPDGQTIYIDNKSRYYYINESGDKVFVNAVQLKNDPDKD
jgi:hypothetical protein